MSCCCSPNLQCWLLFAVILYVIIVLLYTHLRDQKLFRDTLCPCCMAGDDPTQVCNSCTRPQLPNTFRAPAPPPQAYQPYPCTCQIPSGASPCCEGTRGTFCPGCMAAAPSPPAARTSQVERDKVSSYDHSENSAGRKRSSNSRSSAVPDCCAQSQSHASRRRSTRTKSRSSLHRRSSSSRGRGSQRRSEPSNHSNRSRHSHSRGRRSTEPYEPHKSILQQSTFQDTADHNVNTIRRTRESLFPTNERVQTTASAAQQTLRLPSYVAQPVTMPTALRMSTGMRPSEVEHAYSGNAYDPPAPVGGEYAEMKMEGDSLGFYNTSSSPPASHINVVRHSNGYRRPSSPDRKYVHAVDYGSIGSPPRGSYVTEGGPVGVYGPPVDIPTAAVADCCAGRRAQPPSGADYGSRSYEYGYSDEYPYSYGSRSGPPPNPTIQCPCGCGKRVTREDVQPAYVFVQRAQDQSDTCICCPRGKEQKEKGGCCGRKQQQQCCCCCSGGKEEMEGACSCKVMEVSGKKKCCCCSGGREEVEGTCCCKVEEVSGCGKKKCCCKKKNGSRRSVVTCKECARKQGGSSSSTDECGCKCGGRKGGGRTQQGCECKQSKGQKGTDQVKIRVFY